VEREVSPAFRCACPGLKGYRHFNHFSAMAYVNLIIAFAFLSAAIVNLAGPQVIRAEFAKWGYPDWLRVTVSAVELGGAILLCITRTQWLGALMLLVVTLGILVSFTRSKEWMRMQYPFVLFLLLAAILRQPHA